jgi:5-methylcytosine-specific restriction endonuclease McrA
MSKSPFAFGIRPGDIWGIPKKSKKRKNISFTKKAILWEKNKSHICHICRQKIHSLTEAEVDHIRAHSKCGQSLSWAHRACNRMKGKKSLSQIHKELGIKTKKKRVTRKKKRNKGNYWINPITGREERVQPLFRM